jgi:predicted hotdog family 3-hydroxylacyl-ACP dehydratase
MVDRGRTVLGDRGEQGADRREEGDVSFAAGLFVPHKPPLLLVDRLTFYSPEKVTVTAEVKPIPKTDSFVGEGLGRTGVVPGFWALEYFAQSIAVFFGYRSHLDGDPTRLGFILSVDDFTVLSGRDLELGEALTMNVRLIYDVFPLGACEGEVQAKDGVYARVRMKCFIGDVQDNPLGAQVIGHGGQSEAPANGLPGLSCEGGFG